MLLAMPKRPTKKTLTLNKEELEILNEVLTDYKGFVEFTYKNNVAIIAQGENMLRASNDKDQTTKLVTMLEKYKEQSKMLDIARLRADSLHLKVKDVLGIKDEDADTNESWDGAEENDTSADKQDAEVSEGSEVLHEDK